MEDMLSKLELRIKQMIKQQMELQSENSQLNQGQFGLMRERKVLVERQQNTIKRIETLITRLKTIEQTS